VLTAVKDGDLMPECMQTSHDIRTDEPRTANHEYSHVSIGTRQGNRIVLASPSTSYYPSASYYMYDRHAAAASDRRRRAG
jgi:hypothetical protein